MKTTACSKWHLLVLFLLLYANSFSQNKFKVTGKVIDNSGKPVDGATVKVKGQNIFTATKPDGSFEINMPSANVDLVITSTGFAEQTVSVGGKSTITITLASSAGSLDDVVVVGYATVKKSDVTGAVAGINQNDIKSRPVSNAVEAMQGKVAGVDITSNERPGTVGDITIRGVRSLAASNSPLFVVDGIPLTTGGIDNINPNDIASIDVLKDASATAIYGSRGANGVVIVTTKTGKTGKTTLSFNSSVTTQSLQDNSKSMNASQSIDYRRWALYYSNPTLYPRGDQPTLVNDQKNVFSTIDASAWANIAKGWASGTWDGSKVTTTDWKGMVKQTGVTSDNQISVSGGSDKIKAYGSFGYLDNTGVLKGQSYKRYTAKSSIDIVANNWFSMGSNINVAYSVQEFGESSINFGGLVSSQGTGIYESARALFTYTVPYDSAGNKIIYPGGDVAFKTIVNEWNLSQDQRTNLRAFGSLYAQVNVGNLIPILKGLKYRLNFGPDFSLFRDGVYIDAQSVNSAGTNYASLAKSQTFSYTLDNLLYYDKSFGKHTIGVTLLQSQTQFNADSSSISASNIPFASQRWNALTQTNIPAGNLLSYGSNLLQKQLLSYMARVNYGYADKYLLTVSAREDGASQFAPGHKYSLFPSAALAWRINKENFMKSTNWVNDLKLRFGAGVTGNSAVNPYSTLGAITPLFYPFSSTVTAGSLPSNAFANPLLGWEKTTQYNLGIDFSILKRRITGSFDVYTSQTKDLLLNRSIPSVTGYLSTLSNIGQTANKGFDLSLNTVNINSRNFQWTTSLNASWQKDHIVSLANGKQDDINNNWFINQSLNVIYGYQTNGLWHTSDAAEIAKFNANGTNFTPGNVRPVDQNGDYKIDANNDRVIIGSTRPRWVVGMTNSFSYKGFDLSCLIYGRLKYFINTGGESEVGRSNERLINYYTEANQNAEYQKPIYTTATGDIYSAALGYKDGSYLKVRNISMAYTFTGGSLKKTGLSNLRLYFQIANPGMLYSKVKFLDPDVINSTGSATSPTAVSATWTRGFTFGLNAAF